MFQDAIILWQRFLGNCCHANLRTPPGNIANVPDFTLCSFQSLVQLQPLCTALLHRFESLCTIKSSDVAQVFKATVIVPVYSFLRNFHYIRLLR